MYLPEEDWRFVESAKAPKGSIQQMDLISFRNQSVQQDMQVELRKAQTGCGKPSKGAY